MILQILHPKILNLITKCGIANKLIKNISSMNCCLLKFKESYRQNMLLPYSPVFKINQSKIFVTRRNFSSSSCKYLLEGKNNNRRSYNSKQSTLNYVTAIGVLAIGLSYAAVPLYRIFCQAYSYGGTVQIDGGTDKVEALKRVEDRDLTIRFNADTGAAMRWNFHPQQSIIKVVPGETALAFYNARNPTDKPVVGISTYNVLPYEAGQYFNKIQCFCFEEQMLNPNEEVSMPVFFYIDPEFADDPLLINVNEIVLSYTFFEVKDGEKLPISNFLKRYSK